MQSTLKVALTVGALSILLTLGLALSGILESAIVRLPLSVLSVLSIGWVWSLSILKRAQLLEHVALSVLLAVCLPTLGVYFAVRLGASYSETTIAYALLLLFAIPALLLSFRHRNAQRA
jgi:hypothetical protein